MGKCIKVDWSRKATGVNDIQGFGTPHTLCGVNKVTVNPSQYDKMVETLDALPTKVLSKVKSVQVKDWGTSNAVVVRAKGKKPLVIDTQGYVSEAREDFFFH